MCQELFDTIRNHKTEDGRLLCESFIRAPKRRYSKRHCFSIYIVVYKYSKSDMVMKPEFMKPKLSLNFEAEAKALTFWKHRARSRSFPFFKMQSWSWSLNLFLLRDSPYLQFGSLQFYCQFGRQISFLIMQSTFLGKNMKPKFSCPQILTPNVNVELWLLETTKPKLFRSHMKPKLYLLGTYVCSKWNPAL